MSPASLQEFITECREYSLLSSLAGSLSFRHIDLLRSLAPDILGLRGAVCEDGVRTASINREKVSQLKLQLAGAIPSGRQEQLQCAPAD
jgi:hypothetical protein